MKKNRTDEELAARLLFVALTKTIMGCYATQSASLAITPLVAASALPTAQAECAMMELFVQRNRMGVEQETRSPAARANPITMQDYATPTASPGFTEWDPYAGVCSSMRHDERMVSWALLSVKRKQWYEVHCKRKINQQSSKYLYLKSI